MILGSNLDISEFVLYNGIVGFVQQNLSGIHKFCNRNQERKLLLNESDGQKYEKRAIDFHAVSRWFDAASDSAFLLQQRQ